MRRHSGNEQMRTTHRTIVTALLVLLTALGSASQTHAEPSVIVAPGSAELTEARDRALELENKIEQIRGERISLEERISVTNQRIFRQQEVLSVAREGLDEAREAYRQRIIRMYKSRIVDPLAILLSAESLSDLYARAVMLSRISQRDHVAYKDAAVATAEAEYQAAYLDDLKLQDVELRQMQANSLRELEATLREQKLLVEKLTEEALKELVVLQTTIKTTRQEWIDSSVPFTGEVAMGLATVDRYPGRTYIVPEHQPKAYRSLGRIETMVCSWYGNEFNGRPTASGQIFNEEDLTCASRTLPFGTTLALSRGEKRIIVVVTDRGPFIDGRDLDLSKAAARHLGFSGVEPVEAEFVEALN